ncbi:MAG: Rieske 2Fe-2S domain-containing protein, partial [Sphingomonadaceae bacterium]
MFLRNAWYAAGWASELNPGPVSRTILEQAVVLFRTENGEAHALHDTCPHRFAPLSLGKLKADRIICPYHGLEFDGAGTCIRNPHGKGAVPGSLGVEAYPLIERYGMIWIWMGDKSTADPALVPDIPRLEDSAYSWVYGSLEVEANYQLVIDNLLDLSHAEFLHPMLASEGNSERTVFRCEQDGDMVRALYDVTGEPITGLFQILWENQARTADL